MAYRDPLPAKLNELADGVDPHARGHAFEQIVAEIFTRAGFDVVMNPEAASPRQTDMYATAADFRDSYLIEAKWQSDRIGSPEIDDMRVRLGRQPGGVVGAIITMGDVTEQALAEIERDRSQVILIVERSEVRSLVEGSVDLRRLLHLKRRQLVVHAKASGVPPAEFVASALDKSVSPLLVDVAGSTLSWADGTSDYLNSCWALSIPDVDWVTAEGAGVTLDLAVPAASLDDLRQVLNELQALNWLGSNAAWTIQQQRRTWNGFGPDRLLAALDDRAKRYAEIDRAHHREMLVIADACAGGWYTLLVDLDARSDRVQGADLSLQLVGVPDDLAEFARLRRRLGIVSPGYFRPKTERSVRSRRLHEPVEVTPTGWVVEQRPGDPHDALWARGVVFPNPLIGDDDEWPPLVHEESQIIASLRSWHPLSRPRSRYVLERFEWAQSSDATLVQAFVDW